MKHYDPQPPISPVAIQDALAGVGVPVTAAQSVLLSAHSALVADANSRMNLTRIVEPGKVLELHIVDSLAFTPLLAPLTGKIIDIGSGAGYPGIPLAILGCDVLLCESIKKKAAFLADAVRQLELPCTIHAVRAEELAADLREAADVVVARAVTSLPALVELAAPLLRPGGRLIALKGTPGDDEERHARRAASICGLRGRDSLAYSLPSGEARSVYVFERVRSPAVHLPRRPGMAQTQPLGSEDV